MIGNVVQHQDAVQQEMMIGNVVQHPDAVHQEINGVNQHQEAVHQEAGDVLHVNLIVKFKIILNFCHNIIIFFEVLF
jgi:hypothetical protein